MRHTRKVVVCAALAVGALFVSATAASAATTPPKTWQGPRATR